jgi:hypothetical protein
MDMASLEITANLYFLSPAVDNTAVEDAWTCEEARTQ